MRASRIAGARGLLLLAALAAPLLSLGGPVRAAELSSPSYLHRAASVVSGAASQLAAPGPRFGGSGVSVGGPGPVGWSGADADLTTAVSGYWPAVIGAVPSLDVDGDGIPSYLDDDDDGDGLSDAVETNTGTFVSPSDTGTDPVNPDSDGDGFPDGQEVPSGSDPNDPQSIPFPVPLLSWPAAALLVGVLTATAHRRRRETRGGTK